MISASVIERAGGFGFGGGSGSDPGKGDSGVGGGGGGGGTAMARPVAIIEVTPDGSVTVSPVIDFTRILLTVLATCIAVWRAVLR